MFKNKTLLITGGTGSFGNAVLNKFLNSDISEIRIFSRDEKKQHEMRVRYKNSKLKFYIGDVRDFDSINPAMIGVNFVFHAAALKQVPSCEFHPIEAVKTNVLGTENVLNIAIKNNIEKVICLSTDKAVYPINAMGVSKAMMEKIFVAKSRITKSTKIIGTRHGEKLYETLISREEMSKVEDMDQYFRIPSDNRDLNYSKYFTDGEQSISETQDYTSHNTKQLNVEDTVSTLKQLDFIKENLNV